jgi:hypothetical protein
VESRTSETSDRPFPPADDGAVDRYRRAIARIDAANAEDPRRESTEQGELPKELVYAQRMTSWLERVEPRASEVLRLAARAQHLCRWRLPRSEYPDGRQGYLSWRRDCAELHARLAAEILADVGYDERDVARVCDLLRKRGLPHDAEALALEDTACLVFLEHELARFARRRDEPELVRILERTWRKMSPRGRALALALDLEPSARALVEKATASAVR